jgi:hypothetical protein
MIDVIEVVIQDEQCEVCDECLEWECIKNIKINKDKLFIKTLNINLTKVKKGLYILY